MYIFIIVSPINSQYSSSKSFVEGIKTPNISVNIIENKTQNNSQTDKPYIGGRQPNL